MAKRLLSFPISRERREKQQKLVHQVGYKGVVQWPQVHGSDGSGKSTSLRENFEKRLEWREKWAARCNVNTQLN